MNNISLVFSLVSVIVSIISIYFVYKSSQTLHKYFGTKDQKKDILEHLDNYYSKTNNILDNYTELNKRILLLETRDMSNVAVLHSKRFNPYEDSGGDLSYCIVMLDRELNGIMITSLHGRERTRFYGRNIQKGEANIELLYDEKEALKEAKEKLK